MSSTAITEIGHYISGQQVAGKHRAQDVFNPATGAVTGRVALADGMVVDAAVAAAHAAFPEWSDTPPLRRARVMFKFLELLNTHKDKLAL
ncbi:MAG: aldehyde dehydrogenase family protein [Polaromonas sp.]|nr:aldehyde dehydrogenase family protein [Polaromonas sp.]